MSAQLFTVPFQCVVVSGLAVPGATLTFYRTDTSTKLPIYTTSALTTQQTNPVVANGAGNIPDTYLDTAETYRVVIKNKAGTVLEDTDPYIPGITTLGITLTSATGQSVNSRGALAALSPVINNQVAFLTEAGREGMFVFSTANLSASVTADTQQGIYVAPASAPTGASGAWVRRIVGDYHATWWGVVADNSTTNATAAQAAIDAAYAVGATLRFPVGISRHSGLIFKNKVAYRGAGTDTAVTKGTVLYYTGTGDGVQVNNPINSSTAANISVEGITFRNATNNTGKGCFADTGSSHLKFRNCAFAGGDRLLIFDQTELADVTECDFEVPASGTCGVWLVNGADRTGGASNGFTNRISVKSSQFNGSATAYGIVDDGGTAHAFEDNNYNGCLNHIRAAGVGGLVISRGEWEGAANASIVLASTSLAGTAVSSCSPVFFNAPYVIPTAGQPCVAITSAGQITFIGPFFGNTTSAKVTGCANANGIYAFGIEYGGGGAIFDGVATNHFEVGGATPAVMTNIPTTFGPNATVTFTDSGGAGFEGFLQRTSDSPYRIMRVASKGGLGGWQGSFRVQVSTDVNALFDAFSVDAITSTTATANIKTAYKVNGTQVVGAQGAAVADATDAASAITQLNLLLTRARVHGLIAI